MTDQKYEMRISLNVLEHLGINLYSNVSSVLAEVVANSWDADATRVEVNFDMEKDIIVIQDNGDGMNRKEVNERFLTVGYQRRKGQPGMTWKGRLPMGRKGIGKLSLFSIAEQIEVETIKSEDRNAFRLRIDEIRDSIKNGTDTYYPKEIPITDLGGQCGTKITLTGLKKKQTFNTVEGLKKRLARRFSIIGSNNDFVVRVNDSEITPADRGYYEKIQYLWTYGGSDPSHSEFINATSKEDRTEAVKNSSITMRGWLGTVERSNQLKDEVDENLNRIAIFVRGKMAQEDILGDFNEGGVYASYLIGEIYIDELDKYDGTDSEQDEDAATSSRQKIVEDDKRYLIIKNLLRRELKYIQRSWFEQRSKEGTKKALEISVIGEWVNDLPKDLKSRAQRWLGKINQIKVDDEAERRQLWKHAILAFEFYSWSENLEKLDSIDENNIEEAITLFNDLDNLESTLYGQIAKQRIEVIQAMQNKVADDSREKVIQDFLFNHLWLLDASWERAESTEFKESQVAKMFGQVNNSLTETERKGRVDIAYRKTTGKHVIIELKRPSLSLSVYELSAQIQKYRQALKKMLKTTNESTNSIEFICVLGKPPIEWNTDEGQNLVEETLRVIDARYVNYNELLENAHRAYSDYFDEQKKFNRLERVIEEIEDFAPKINGAASNSRTVTDTEYGKEK